MKDTDSSIVSTEYSGVNEDVGMDVDEIPGMAKELRKLLRWQIRDYIPSIIDVRLAQ